MKTISDYTIHCTESQTRKALELGAPIDHNSSQFDSDCTDNIELLSNGLYAIIPTAEQMIGFILESGKGYSTDLSELIREQGYKQGCLTFIDNCLKL